MLIFDFLTFKWDFQINLFSPKYFDLKVVIILYSFKTMIYDIFDPFLLLKN